MKNFYNKIKSKPTKLDKNYEKHKIMPASMIASIGMTGCGKTNALMNFLDKKRDSFHDIIIFTGSTTEEPLYKFLEDKIDGLLLTNDLKDVPNLTEWDDEDNDKEKLIVFDDFINLPKKDLKKIQDYLIGGRKRNFTVYVVSQNYREIPKTISRNIHYFFIFKQNDNSTLNNIIRNHNVDNLDSNYIKDFYADCVKDPMNFMMIDMRTKDPEERLRKNFGHEVNPSRDIVGSSAKSGFVKKLLYKDNFDINKIKNPSQNLKLNFP